MYKKSHLFLLIAFITALQTTLPNTIDVTVVGYILFANGLGRNTIGALEYFQDDVSMNFIDTRPKGSFTKPTTHLIDVSSKVKNIVNAQNRSAGKVAILYDQLYLPRNKIYKHVPPSSIKLAYTMIETSVIPAKWVDILNSNFDAAVVPDVWLIDVYKSSGVKIPIFVLPHGVYMDEFLAQPLKTKAQNPFIFGTSCSLSPHKNWELLLEAFAREFGHTREVKLKIHIAGAHEGFKIKQKIAALSLQNVDLHIGALSWSEYIAYMASLDCYVLLSKGEGFSVTPREALALGIPCVISNATAHKTICESGCVYAVPANICEDQKINPFYRGFNFNCTLEDACKGLREVYEHYDAYLKKAHQGREWVKRYHYNNLKKYYITLFKPRKVLLGDKNIVTDEFLMTTSPLLYEKYLSFNQLI